MYIPTFQIRPSLLNLIVQISELRVWIAQSMIDVAWISNLQLDIEARMAHSSTAIEGNPLTLPQVEALARGD